MCRTVCVGMVQRGFSLPLTLLVLVIGGAFVTVSFTMVENTAKTSNMTVEALRDFNDATGGVEINRKTVYDAMEAGDLRRWDTADPSGRLTAAEVASYRTAHPGAESLDVLRVSGWSGGGASASGGTISWDVYDLRYAPQGGLSPSGLPPAAEDFTEFLKGSSVVIKPGGISFVDRIGVYLIRGRVRDRAGALRRTVEAAVLQIRP